MDLIKQNFLTGFLIALLIVLSFLFVAFLLSIVGTLAEQRLSFDQIENQAILETFWEQDANITISDSEIIVPVNYSFNVTCTRNHKFVEGVWSFWGGNFDFDQKWVSLSPNIYASVLTVRANTRNENGAILFFEKDSSGKGIWREVVSYKIKTVEV